ncbi:MAG: phosphatidate cytidylyltransferase [Dongiaceae bacterium]
MSGPLLQRIVASAVLMAVALAALWAGSPFWAVLIALVGGAMSWEWSAMTGAGGFDRLGAAILGIAVLAILAADRAGPVTGVGLLAAGALLTGLALVFIRPPRPALWPLAGLAYVGLPAIALVWLRNEGGFVLCLWLLVLVWAVDSVAYFVGRAVGGPKLAPSISPKKTWAGLAGGCVAAALVGLAAGFSLGIDGRAMMGLGILLALIEQGGDLLESAVKRRFKVKDSSSLIPGHGGVLDRVDGLVAVALAVAAIMVLADRAPLFP